MRRLPQATACHLQVEAGFSAAPAEDQLRDRKRSPPVSQFSLLADTENPAISAEDRSSDGKLAYSVSQFAEVSDLSRSLLYEAIRLGESQSIKVRGRRLILVDDGKAWLRSFRAPE